MGWDPSFSEKLEGWLNTNSPCALQSKNMILWPLGIPPHLNFPERLLCNLSSELLRDFSFSTLLYHDHALGSWELTWSQCAVSKFSFLTLALPEHEGFDHRWECLVPVLSTHTEKHCPQLSAGFMRQRDVCLIFLPGSQWLWTVVEIWGKELACQFL